MALSPTSRYHGLPVYQAPDAKGRLRPTVAIRRTAEPSPDARPYRHTLIGGQTLETLAHRFLNNSEHWWRIADVNERRFPLDWTSGDPIAIPTGDDAGRVVRDRRF